MLLNQKYNAIGYKCRREQLELAGGSVSLKRQLKSEKHAFLDAMLDIYHGVLLTPLQQQRTTSKSNGDARGERGSSAPK